MRSIISFILLLSIYSSCYSQQINCRIQLKFEHASNCNEIYLNSEDFYYIFDSINISSGLDSICLAIDEPLGVTLFIDNDAEHSFQFYLCEGNYKININCKDKTANVNGSTLNDEFKEKMQVNDSLFKKFNIMHAMLYPYNGMDRDSAHIILEKYLPICNELSEKHIQQFYTTHPSSYLTLEYIYNTLGYTFINEGNDTTKDDVKRLKIMFDNLDSRLKKYKLYNKCLEMFSKERDSLTTPPKPLFIYDNTNKKKQNE